MTRDLWPDFNEQGLVEALRSYCTRERKYGAVQPEDTATSSGASREASRGGQSAVESDAFEEGEVEP